MVMNLSSDVITALRMRREQLGLTSREAARRIGVVPEMLSTWETRRKRPTFESVLAWAQALGLEMRLERPGR